MRHTFLLLIAHIINTGSCLKEDTAFVDDKPAASICYLYKKRVYYVNSEAFDRQATLQALFNTLQELEKRLYILSYTPWQVDKSEDHIQIPSTSDLDLQLTILNRVKTNFTPITDQEDNWVQATKNSIQQMRIQIFSLNQTLEALKSCTADYPKSAKKT